MRRIAVLLSAAGLVLGLLGIGLATATAAGTCTIIGGPNDDVLSGTGGTDVICGRDGNDTISGFGSADDLRGGFGDDHLYGGKGRDLVAGAQGADVAAGGHNGDSITGGPGADSVLGEGGDDSLDVRDQVVGNDTGDGGEGFDTCAVDPDDVVINCERGVRSPIS